MANKIECVAKDVKELTKWLKRFSVIEKSVLIELDEETSTLIGKTYNEEKSIVKMSSINLGVCGLTFKPSKNPKRIKMGIVSLSQIIKVLEHFNSGEFTLVINHDEVLNNATNVKEQAMTSFVCKNDNLKMSIEGAPMGMFKYLSDDKFKTDIAQLDNEYPVITFTQKDMNEITSLCSMDDSDYKFIDIIIKEGKFVVSGKIFNKLISSSCSSDIDFKITLFKQMFEKLDNENYDLILGEDRMICKSTDSDTVTVLAEVEKIETELNKDNKEDAPF